MNSTIKGLIKQTTPMKWLLGRLNKLEKALQESRKSDKHLETQIANLEKVIKEQKTLNDQNTAKINRLEKNLKSKDNDIRCKMKYLYYKGLQPNQYAENLKEWYKEQTGETLDLEHPKTYNEKVQWMKLYDSTPIKTRLADKYLVREWVAEKIGEEYLVPILGVYDKFSDIDFDVLPDKFVLKTNHGAGWNIIVKDKSKLNIEDARRKIQTWMGKNFAFVFGLELHYLNISPKIIIEEYLEEIAGQLYDYKFMCFGGEVKFIWVDIDRFTGHKRTLFTIEWEPMREKIRWLPADHEIPKPKNLDKMLELATKLSQGFSHVRVDFYNVNGKIYFGEMTFTNASGIEIPSSEEFALEMGEWIKLPEKSEIPILKRI